MVLRHHHGSNIKNSLFLFIYLRLNIRFDPALTYGRLKKQQVQPFRPHYVIYDKKTLKFMGYFRQHVPESRIEQYRIRYVNIYYYLEDDTMEVYEPFVKVTKFYF